MTIHRFFVPDVDADAGKAHLTSDQSRQVSRVLRARAGDAVVLFDGAGYEYAGLLESREDGRWSVAISGRSRPEREPELDICVGLALIRNERFDLAVQKLTEVGVRTVVPILAERSVISYKDERSWLKRRDRLGRIVTEAAEQSERTTLTSIENPQTVEQFLDERSERTVYAFVERESVPHLSELAPHDGRVSILVGPEGGWTGVEVELIETHATSASLGDLILRSETAAIAAASFLVLGAAGRKGTDDD